MNLVKAALLLIAMSIICLYGCSGSKDDGKSATAFPDSIVDDQVIATVNNYTILGKELRIFSTMFGMARQQNLTERDFNGQLLDEFIRRILLWQEAVAVGVTVDDSTTQAIFGEFSQSIGGEEVLQQRLVQANVTREDLLVSIHRDLVIRQFLDTHFVEEAKVNEEEVRSYFEENRDKFSVPDSVRARHIILPVDADAEETVKQDKRKAIEDILKQAKAGSDFGQLAQEYSEGPSKSRGGDLGFFHRGTMVQPFDSVAFALRVGEISGVVETQYGYHIIKVEEIKHGRSIAFEEINEELLAQLQQQKMVMAVQNHLNEMLELAIIERNYTP
ncbi:MAG: peptidylprolyl isomerase [Candidatus Latescibacterota bacterium]